MASVLMTRKESIVDQLEQLHQRIARRAYELFRGRDGWGDSFGDWLSAERELVWKPAVELREQDGTFNGRRRSAWGRRQRHHSRHLAAGCCDSGGERAQTH